MGLVTEYRSYTPYTPPENGVSLYVTYDPPGRKLIKTSPTLYCKIELSVAVMESGATDSSIRLIEQIPTSCRTPSAANALPLNSEHPLMPLTPIDLENMVLVVICGVADSPPPAPPEVPD